MKRLFLALSVLASPGAPVRGGAGTVEPWKDKDPQWLTAGLDLAAGRAAVPVPALPAALSLSGYVSVWYQDCPAPTAQLFRSGDHAPVSSPGDYSKRAVRGMSASGVCAIPVAVLQNRPVSFELPLPQLPGQAQPRVIREVFSLGTDGELSLLLSFYAVCPYAGDRPSDTAAGAAALRPYDAGCPAGYFQAQAELAGAAGAFCAVSLNEKDFAPFPVLMCGGDKAQGRRFGVTLHRDRF